MKTIATIGVLFLCRMAPAAAEEYQVLTVLFSKSELVVAATIVSDPMAVARAFGVTEYSCKVEVSQLLKGKIEGRELTLTIIHYESTHEEILPFVKKGGKCILFLKVRPDTDPKWKWVTADMWFGAQPYNSAMITALKSLAAEEKGKGKAASPRKLSR